MTGRDLLLRAVCAGAVSVAAWRLADDPRWLERVSVRER